MDNDPTNWHQLSDTIAVGEPMTEAWLDRFRALMEALNAARTAIRLADEYLVAGEGVGLRYYFFDFADAHAKFDAALGTAGIELDSDKPIP